MKPDALQGRPGVFGFNDANKMVDFAMEQGMVVRGHTLVWHAKPVIGSLGIKKAN